MALPAPPVPRVAADRPQSFGEELANAVSHGVGCLLAIAALPILVIFARREGTAINVVAASVFAATMIVLYLVSTLYHAVPDGRAKRLLNRLDHAAIYLFIAGSYTPFALGVLHGTWGWTMFGIVWALAAVGIAAKLFNRLRHPLWSTGLYLAMGWLALLVAGPLFSRMTAGGIAWLLVGGVAYSAGAIVFLFDHRLRYGHFVWHLFVIAGSACHFFAALWHANSTA